MAAKKKAATKKVKRDDDYETPAQRKARYALMDKRLAESRAAKAAAEKKMTPQEKKQAKQEERLKNLEAFVWNIQWRLDRYKKKDESFFPEDIEQDLKDYKLK